MKKFNKDYIFEIDNGFELFDNNIKCNVIDIDDINNNYKIKWEDLNLNNEGIDISNFNFNNCEIYLSKSNEYMGKGNYEGIIIKDNKKYYMEVVNEGKIYYEND